MTQPGWYPDPAGTPGLFRWWDGAQWTPTVTAQPATTPPPPPAGQPAARTPGQPFGTQASAGLPMRDGQAGWAAYEAPEQRASGRGPVLVLALVGLLLVGLIAGGVALFTGGLPNPFAGERPASNPTGDVCPRRGVQTVSPTPHVDLPGRVRGGKLSYPRLGGEWGPVVEEDRVPFGRDVRGQSVMLHSNYDGRGSSWVASVTVGELVAGDGFFSPQQGSEIVTRCVLGVFYGDAVVQRQDVRSEAIQVDGHDAWVTEMHLGFQIPRLAETGETAIVIIVDTGEESASLYYASVPDSRPDLLEQTRRLQQQLRVER